MVRFLLGLCILYAGILRAEETQPESASRIRALQHYISASLTDDPASRTELLLESVRENPYLTESLTMLDKIRNEHPDLAEKIIHALIPVAEKNPGSFKLVLMVAEAVPDGNPDPESLLSAAIRLGNNTASPEGERRTDFLALVQIQINRMMRKNQYDEADKFLTELCSTGDNRIPELCEWTAELRRKAALYAEKSARSPGEWREAASAMLDIVRKTDGRLRHLQDVFRRTDFYIRMHCFDDACRYADYAARHWDDGSMRVQVLKITVLLRIRRYGEALALLRETMRGMPPHPGLQRLLAEGLLCCGDEEGALEAGRKLTAMQPDEPEYLLYIVMPLIRQKRYGEARQVISSVKHVPLQLRFTGLLNAFTQDAARMTSRLRKLQKNPDYKGGDAVYLALLNIASSTRDTELLAECWREMEKLGSLKEEINANNLGYVAADLNFRLEDARKLIEQAYRSEPENEVYLDSMAWVSYRQGRYSEAWEYISRALDNADWDNAPMGVMLDHAGDIAFKLEKYETALDCFRKAQGDYLSGELDMDALRTKIRNLEKQLSRK